MTQQITCYLPLSIASNSGRDYANNLWRTQLLIKSLDKFFTSSLTLMIVSPACQLNQIQNTLFGTSKIVLQFIDQEIILPGITKSPMSGWYKQQVISFAMTVMYPDLTILKLDPDLILVNPIDHADFFQESRTANDMWRMQTNEYAPPYIYCSSMLDMTIPDLSWGLKWTPFILNPHVVSELIFRLKSRGMSLLDLADKKPWTETLLYSIIANSSTKIEDFHFQAPLIGSMLNGKKQIFNFRIKPEDGIFATLQGYTGITQNEAHSILKKSNILL